MRAHIFFWLCAGIASSLILFSFVSVPLGAIAVSWVVAMAAAFAVPHPYRVLSRAYCFGFAFGVARIMAMPHDIAFSGAWFGPLGTWLAAAAERFGGIFGRLYPEPIAGFVQGILTGSRNVRIEPGFAQALRNTSTFHLVAVSGYNVTLVGTYVYTLLGLLTVPRKAIWLAVLAFLALFTAFVGAPASAVRASIMAGLVVAAERFYRSAYARNAIMAAATVMLVAAPSLLFDLGFQLSFLATMGILYVAPAVKEKFLLVREPSVIGSVTLETCSAQLMVLPLIVQKFGTVSLLGLAANVVVLPVVPLATGLGAMVGFSYILFEPLARLLALVSMPFFLFIVKSIEAFGVLPFASVAGVRMPWWAVVAYYAFGFLWLRARTERAPTSHA